MFFALSLRSFVPALLIVSLLFISLLMPSTADAGTWQLSANNPVYTCTASATGGATIAVPLGTTPPRLPNAIKGGGGAGSSLTITGTASFQWTWTSTTTPKEPPPKNVLLTKLATSGGIIFSGSGTISPSAAAKYELKDSSSGTISLSMPVKATVTFSGTGGGVDPLAAGATVLLSPIVISSPNPLGRPDLGDGSNQFVYDGTVPKGYLNFPGAIQAVGASAAATAWLMRDPTAGAPHVGLTLDLPAESVSQNWYYLDHTLNASVPTDQIVVKYGSLSSPSDGFLYLGLPKSNSGFGNHLVTLTVDGKTSQQAHIQTFFSLKASNWPSTDGKVPNWFHYWSLTSAFYGSPVYDNGSRCHTSYDSASSKWIAYIDNDTVSGQFPCYDNASGIDALAWECRHEAQHVENATSWWGNTPISGSNTSYNPSKDKDGDGIPDTLEHNLGMNFHPELNGYDPTSPVTPRLSDHFKYGADYNDNEDYTQHMQRQNHSWTNGSADKEDWASPGHQKK